MVNSYFVNRYVLVFRVFARRRLDIRVWQFYILQFDTNISCKLTAKYEIVNWNTMAIYYI